MARTAYVLGAGRVLMALALVIAAVAAAAQSIPRVYRIGFLSAGDPFPLAIWSFPSEMAKLGYVEGGNLVIERRFSGSDPRGLPTLVGELLTLKVDVLVTTGGQATQAAKDSAPTLPIVFNIATNPVRRGFVQSFARPGGNLTGWVGGLYEEKQLEMLREAVPSLRRVAVLWDATYGPAPADWKPARALGLEAQFYMVSRPDDLELGIAAAARTGADGLLVDNSPMLERHSKQIGALALRHRLPAIGSGRVSAQDGLLLAYGPRSGQNWARIAHLVDRILKGAKPADLPVEQTTLFDLVVNLQTARALSLTLPRAVLLRADEVLE